MKTQIQKLSSSKLYYNKWPYKVECTIFGAYLLSRFHISEVKDWCNGNSNITMGSSYGGKNISKPALLAFATLVEPYLKNKSVQIRTEGSHFNIFCKDKVVLENIDATLYNWIRKISGPTTDEELEFLLSNSHKKRLCDTLPKGRFRYKIIFKTKFSQDKKEQFLSWCDHYLDKIEISATTKRWLKNERLYAQDPFMYITDEKMLSMLWLYLGENIKRVEEFIPRNSVLMA